MPRLSIIIALQGNVDRLESTLVSVLENRPAGCEVLVVLNGPYEDPYHLKDEVRFLPARPGARLIECFNLGIEASRSGIVHLLAAGVEATEGWADHACRHFQDGHVAAVAAAICDPLDAQRVLALGVHYRAGGQRVVQKPKRNGTSPATLGPLLIAAFYRRSVLAQLGGLPADVGDELADVDLGLTLQHLGLRAVAEPESRIRLNSDLLDSTGGFGAGLAAERLFWRSAPLVGWKRALVMHPLAVAWDSLVKLPRPSAVTRVLGRLLGLCQIGSHRQHHLQREQWKAERNAAAELPATLRIDQAHPAAGRAAEAQPTTMRQAS